MQCADDPLVIARIVDRLPRRLHPAAQGRFRHDAFLPDCLVEVVLGDGAVAVFDQIAQQVENLGLDWPGDVAAAQFIALRIKLAIGKSVDQ